MCEHRDCGAQLIILQGHFSSVWEVDPVPQSYIRTDIMPSNSAAFDVLSLFLHITHLGTHSLGTATASTNNIETPPTYTPLLSSPPPIPPQIHLKVFLRLAQNI